MSNPRHLVVCSVENRHYHAWQAKVFTYSCMAHQNVAPLLLVHGGHEDLDPGFEECEKAGALVVPTRNHRFHNGVEWAARNTVAALIDAAMIGEELGATHVVIMDPDLVWTRKESWPTTLSVDKCPNDLRSGLADQIAKAEGLQLGDGANAKWGSRVPYVVPIEQAEDIGWAWWHFMDRFADHEFHWSDQMRAWCLALAALGLPPQRINLTQTNWRPEARVKSALIHYAYPNHHFAKAWYAEPGDGSPWDPKRLPVSSVQGWVHREIVRAGEFYEQLKEVPA